MNDPQKLVHAFQNIYTFNLNRILNVGYRHPAPIARFGLANSLRTRLFLFLQQQRGIGVAKQIEIGEYNVHVDFAGGAQAGVRCAWRVHARVGLVTMP